MNTLKQSLKRVAARRGLHIARINSEIGFGFLVDHLLGGRKSISFVQIGAYDGISNDPVFPLMQRYVMNGLIVEPQPRPCELLRERYRARRTVKVLNMAVGERSGLRPFFTVSEQLAQSHPWAGQLASFSREVVLSHRNEIPEIEQHVVAGTVISRPLMDLVDEHDLARADVLVIDTEGYDGAILGMIDFSRMFPLIIRYEHKHLSAQEADQCAQLLTSKAYRLLVERHDTTAFLPSGVP